MSRPRPDDFRTRFPALKRIAFGSFTRRIPVVRQLAAADCGAAALTMVIRYHGKDVLLDEVRTLVGSGRNGASAASLLRVGRAYGLRGRGVRLEIEDLEHLPPGSILFWEFRHFVVLARARRKTVEIVDPATGRRSVLIENFRRAFTGVALVFEPTEGFEVCRAKSLRVLEPFRAILQCRDLLTRIITTSILTQILSLALPLFTGVVIDRVVPRKDYSLLLVLTSGYCVFQAFNVIAGLVRSHLLIHLRAQLEVRFTLGFLDHLIALPYSYFQQHTSGDLMVRLGSNSNVREILTSATLSTFLDGSMASVYLLLLLIASAPLTVAVILLAATRFALLGFVRWRQRQILNENLDNKARTQTYQMELLCGMETLKSMGLEQQAAERWSQLFVDGLNISIKGSRLDAMFTALSSGLGTVTSLTLMFYGAYLVLRGDFTLGTMMAFSALAGGFLGPLSSLVSSALQLQMLEVYLERLNDVMRTPTEQDGTALIAPGLLSGAVSLEHVCYRYSAQDALVLDDVSIRISPGSKIAIVGRTGSGKSTLARLLAGLYDPSAGRILFDYKDIRSLARRSLRNQLGIVTQETQLFGGSVRRNIALADPDMSLDRVIRSAKLACIHDEIAAMPMGYETTLVDRGLSMSGGQRQRLAIARALAIGPAILILDEATSQLDAVTEHQINANLASLRSTRIVIAHRLSTIRDADIILVLAEGKVVDSGSHDELIRLGGPYAELVRMQRDIEPSCAPS